MEDDSRRYCSKMERARAAGVEIGGPATGGTEAGNSTTGCVRMNQAPDLCAIAQRVVWFESADEILRQPKRFLAYLMTFGTVEEILLARKYFSAQDFEAVLADPPAGIFDDAPGTIETEFTIGVPFLFFLSALSRPNRGAARSPGKLSEGQRENRWRSPLRKSTRDGESAGAILGRITPRSVPSRCWPAYLPDIARRAASRDRISQGEARPVSLTHS